MTALMKGFERLRCRLRGHDWRSVLDQHGARLWCRRCDHNPWGRA